MGPHFNDQYVIKIKIERLLHSLTTGFTTVNKYVSYIKMIMFCKVLKS